LGNSTFQWLHGRSGLEYQAWQCRFSGCDGDLKRDETLSFFHNLLGPLSSYAHGLSSCTRGHCGASCRSRCSIQWTECQPLPLQCQLQFCSFQSLLSRLQLFYFTFSSAVWLWTCQSIIPSGNILLIPFQFCKYTKNIPLNKLFQNNKIVYHSSFKCWPYKYINRENIDIYISLF